MTTNFLLHPIGIHNILNVNFIHVLTKDFKSKKTVLDKALFIESFLVVVSRAIKNSYKN